MLHPLRACLLALQLRLLLLHLVPHLALLGTGWGAVGTHSPHKQHWLQMLRLGQIQRAPLAAPLLAQRRALLRMGLWGEQEAGGQRLLSHLCLAWMQGCPGGNVWR